MAPAAFAQSADNSGWFVGGNAGRTEIKKGTYDGGDTGYSVGGGYRWGLFPWLAVGFEVGYNDLGNIKAKNLFNNQSVVGDKSQLHGWTVGMNQRFAFGPKWYASVRGGVYGWQGHGLSNDDLTAERHDLDKVSWYAGAGAGYNFTDHLSAGLAYDHYDAKKLGVDLSTNMASANVEYRF
jgi:opacity protein-like surface antigen